MRQVSFTLLMTGHRAGNPAQYERNRRFGHLVHVLGRETSGAKLPSVGLRLNASKSESCPSIAMISCAPAAFAGIVRGGNASAFAEVLVPTTPRERLSISRLPRQSATGAPSHSSWFSAAVSNRLQTTQVPVVVPYVVEQPPHCDLLRLSQ